MLQLLQNKNFPYLSCNAYFIKIGNNHFVIDTGNYFMRNELLMSLETNNIHPDEIDFVVNTHLHFDHCGNNEMFPNARIIMPAEELDFIVEVLRRSKKDSFEYIKRIYPLIPDDKIKNFLRMIYAHEKSYVWLLTHLKRVMLIEKDTELLPGVNLVSCHGHSSGHISMVYQQEKICFSGDIIGDKYKDISGNYNLNFIVTDYDMLEESKKKLFSMAEIFYPGHGDYIYKTNPESQLRHKIGNCIR